MAQSDWFLAQDPKQSKRQRVLLSNFAFKCFGKTPLGLWVKRLNTVLDHVTCYLVAYTKLSWWQMTEAIARINFSGNILDISVWKPSLLVFCPKCGLVMSVKVNKETPRHECAEPTNSPDTSSRNAVESLDVPRSNHDHRPSSSGRSPYWHCSCAST